MILKQAARRTTRRQQASSRHYINARSFTISPYGRARQAQNCGRGLTYMGTLNPHTVPPEYSLVPVGSSRDVQTKKSQKAPNGWA